MLKNFVNTDHNTVVSADGNLEIKWSDNNFIIVDTTGEEELTHSSPFDNTPSCGLYRIFELTGVNYVREGWKHKLVFDDVILWFGNDPVNGDTCQIDHVVKFEYDDDEDLYKTSDNRIDCYPWGGDATIDVNYPTGSPTGSGSYISFTKFAYDVFGNDIVDSESFIENSVYTVRKYADIEYATFTCGKFTIDIVIKDGKYMTVSHAIKD